MRILILGSGAREHAIAWKLKSEIGKENIFTAPGNGGTELCGTNVDIKYTDFAKLKDYCVSNDIDTILPGSEDAIANGVRDYFESHDDSKHIYVFSPDKHAGQLESSKAFAKEFMAQENIPTAAYKSFTKSNVEEGYQFLESLNAPYVLKADGLAAGKGVLILNDLEEAKSELKNMLVEEKFGAASSTVVIEEFLDGIEFSVFALTDGENYVLLPEAKDYKRIGEGDVGLNTGGMGAVSPVPFYTDELRAKTIKKVVEPTIKGLKKQSLNFRGFVFFGLIVVNDNPFVIEYNVRMGDPETEVVIPRLDESLSQLVTDAKNNSLSNRTAKTKSDYATTVFAVSGGYPESYEKGKAINLGTESETLFHAGTKRADNELITSGGRVLAATCFGNTMENALAESYSQVKGIDFDKKHFRTDIGDDLKKYL
ncbi:phosphoribosylamine--glycine ligase [uncultured Kiloniella sp.]|uniref:phosphoribosylamine--glycine ligase n=1 Tax=uncultured Kiloniella sp. TaxID=1133091 RepID=UPI00261B2B9A|nr:phosphoribosylamine--glycine ligase [uncultured Kiloniella sp.]